MQKNSGFAMKDCLLLPYLGWEFFNDKRDIGKGYGSKYTFVVNESDSLFVNPLKVIKLVLPTKFLIHT